MNTKEKFELNEIYEEQFDRLRILTEVIWCCSYYECNLEPADICYINELLQNEINLFRKDLGFKNVV